MSFDMQLQAEAKPGVDAAEDQAVIDALLYRYGAKTGTGESISFGAEKTKSTGKSNGIQKGSETK